MRAILRAAKQDYCMLGVYKGDDHSVDFRMAYKGCIPTSRSTPYLEGQRDLVSRLGFRV